MSGFSIQEVLDSTGAVLVRGQAQTRISGLSTDTRTLKPGELFLALEGPNFDGNDYAARACERGAGALLLRGTPEGAPPGSGGELPGEVPVAIHPDPRRALGDLAAWHRSRLTIPVVGITGSCGKTTTKDALLQLLDGRAAAVGSPRSYNNDVGLPHTILMADASTEVLVVEMGTNHPGEIAALSRIARPTGGVITNVGASHLEGLGSVEGVAREKSELFASLPPDGFAVLNLDSLWAEVLRDVTRARLITISVEGEGELNAVEPWFHAGGTTFRLEGQELTCPLLGLHNLHNLLAALATCRGLGLELEEVLPAVSRLKGGRRRMERHDVGGLSLFDDTWNANPESARAAVRVLSGLHGFRRRVLVLGDMLELGESAPELHHAVGRDAARGGIDQLVLVGELTRATAAGALECGLPSSRVLHLSGVEEALETVPALLTEGDVVLLKGSRRTGLERLVDRLRDERGGGGA